MDGLRALGAHIRATDDGFVVSGVPHGCGATIDARGDHRIAMLGAVAGLASARASRSGTRLRRVSFPGFRPSRLTLRQTS